VPGDQLRIEMRVIRRKGSVAKMSGRATVNGLVVAEAEVMCKLEDKVPKAGDILVSTGEVDLRETPAP
jgi:hypothetical protein